ncbi:hypothetical protein [Pseudomonas schmalbachii]|uniref:Lipoprotein n=1 Tax=Pseudomonas schmalbachii TaxID=2816993 RepID=A0ABS3TT81_9PSED|nr:hypothetical protein [Pseudomonas schmalbachii]MBO3276887.1 hypothetical protein [Pseudomonas schmalbachii]
MKGRFAGVLALALLLSACGSREALRPSMAVDLQSIVVGQTLALRIEPGERRLLRSEVANDGAGIIQHGTATAQNLHSSVSGVGNSGAGGGSALGVAIGMALVAGMTQTSVQDARQTEADQRVAPLQSALDARPRHDWFGEHFAAALTKAGKQVSDAAVLTLVVAPQGVLSRDSRSLKLVSEIELMQGRQSIYRGRIETQGDALACSACLDQWAADDASAYLQALDANVRETVRVLLLDWQTGHFAGQLGDERTLRYQIGDSRYVERGRLWQGSRDSGALFLTLRDWIKSVPTGIEP